MIWLILFIIVPAIFFIGRAYGVHQMAKAIDKYSEAAAMITGKPVDNKKNRCKECGGQWGQWINIKVNIVTPSGRPTGNSLSGQKRNCKGCGIKEVRTDI